MTPESLFPDGETDEDQNEDGDGAAGILERIRSRIAAVIGRDPSEEKDKGKGKGSGEARTGTGSGDSEQGADANSWRSYIPDDRSTLLVIAGEVVLVLYFALALLGYVPYF